MSEYKLTVGLEIHAELATKTKMFCDSKNDADEERPNVNVCPICMGHPGTLPVINKEAVRSVLRLGVAVDGELADYTEFDRKNYFYPDIPKGYQISQYKHPLIRGGNIVGVDITRIHLEEDTAKSTHSEKSDSSLLDFNRAGVPLMELVTEPVIHEAKTAGDFARELQLLLTYLGISHANMEKGEMRVEANISVSKTDELGTKVEVKNLNSFKAVERAIQYEYDRHVGLLESGEKIVQETRGWDEDKQKTFSQRQKEESHDYRYFPEPDLPKLYISEIPEFSIDNLRDGLPELPNDKRERYVTEYGLKTDDIDFYIRNRDWSAYLERVVDNLLDKSQIQLASNYIISDLKDDSIEPGRFAKVVVMLKTGEVSARGAKDLLAILKEELGEPKELALKHGLIQKSDRAELEKVVDEILSANEKAVNEYKGGKESSLQFLVGQAMRATKGAGNPQVLKEIFLEKIK
jgi:aspartyl-tRNA(Asn)/glutamyl-tRNA(Gln) amidotransferase subunit B